MLQLNEAYLKGKRHGAWLFYFIFVSYVINQKDMLKKGEHIAGIPAELQILLDSDKHAKAFFETLSKSYKQGYCDWIGSAKQESTRQSRAEKAILMLRNNQKTLKTV